jgi:hypothetical protein
MKRMPACDALSKVFVVVKKQDHLMRHRIAVAASVTARKRDMKTTFEPPTWGAFDSVGQTICRWFSTAPALPSVVAGCGHPSFGLCTLSVGDLFETSQRLG